MVFLLERLHQVAGRLAWIIDRCVPLTKVLGKIARLGLKAIDLFRGFLGKRAPLAGQGQPVVKL